MNLALPFCLALTLALPCAAHAATLPSGGSKDIRIRTAVYDPDQVFVVETDLRFATTIRFAEGERFTAVIAGDTESFEINPLADLGNVIAIKPHVAGAVTNLTVLTNRRSYAFELREGTIKGRTGRFYEVRFRYPEDERKKAARSASFAKAFQAPKNYAYAVSGKADFEPASVYDDGRFTYFRFAEGTRQPAIFKAGKDGRERTVNWTQLGDVVRVLGVSDFWTLRIDEEALCIAKDTSAITQGN